METKTVELNEYPLLVQLKTKVEMSESWWSTCTYYPAMGTALVKCNPFSFRHELGHAVAYIMGINDELGRLVKALPGSDVETNDNLFCYGAQQLAKGNFETAIAEYAATAIEYYYSEEWSELPTSIIEYLDGALAD